MSLTPQQTRQTIELLQNGAQFRKSSDRGKGKPKNRWLWCSKNLDCICWSETRRAWMPSTARTDTIQDVHIDKHTKNRFSIVLPKRTLEFEAASEADRDTWVRCLRLLPSLKSPTTSTPFNVQHLTHVDKNLEWSGDMSKIIILEDLLGEGSFGQVYRGVHRDSGATMAVKLIVADDFTEIAQEINILKQCSHANIVSYYGCWGPDKEGRLWIMMDFCDAGDIGVLLELSRSRLPEPLIRYICICAVRALVFLHAKRIMHRDIKSGNILLTKAGDVKLADFGVSKQIQATIRRGGIAEIAGSPLWMAPEVIKGRPASYNSDIWSLGITAIELAEGAPPHSDITSYSAMRAIARDDAPRLTSARWSKDFRDFVETCLEKDAEKRPGAIELAQHKFVSNVDEPKLKSELCRYLKRHQKTKRKTSSFGAVLSVMAQRALNKSNADSPTAGDATSKSKREADPLESSFGTTCVRSDESVSGVHWKHGEGFVQTPNNKTSIMEGSGTFVVKDGPNTSRPWRKSMPKPGADPSSGPDPNFKTVALTVAGVAIALWWFFR